MESRDVVPTNIPGVGESCRGAVHHTGVEWWVCHAGWCGCVMQGWGGSYRGGMIHTEHSHHLCTLPPSNYLELLGEPNSTTTTHIIT